MVFDVIRALGRRWYIVVVGLVLSSAGAFGAYVVSPPTYQSDALVLMLPAQAEVKKGGNPFLLLSGLEQPAGILAAYFSSTTMKTEIAKLSPTATYEVALDDSTRGPVLSVSVTDEARANTLQIQQYLLDRLPQELADLQRQVGARGSSVVTSMPLVVDTDAKVDYSRTMRAVIAAFVVGLIATGAAAFALDGGKLRRRTSEVLVLEEPVLGSIRAAAPTAQPQRASGRVVSASAAPSARPTASAQEPTPDRVDLVGTGWTWEQDA